MPLFNEREGDLLKLALEGEFGVIAHGCNCFCTMGAGIAPQMNITFGAGSFRLEAREHIGKINKLGMIDWASTYIKKGEIHRSYIVDKTNLSWEKEGWKKIYIVNCYTQYGLGGQPNPSGSAIPVDYEAIQLCMRKMNHVFKGKHIGLPLIGCGLAGGDWEVVKGIIQEELRECDVTIVHYKPKNHGNFFTDEIRETNNGDA